MITEAPHVEFVYHESWRAGFWDDDVPSRPGWELRCTACGGLKPGWTYAERRTAHQVATRHLRIAHKAAKAAGPACPVPEKLAFDSKQAALAKATSVAKSHSPQPVTAYECPCGSWHLTKNRRTARKATA